MATAWTKLFPKKIIIDAFDLNDVIYRPIMVINAHGELFYHSQIAVGPVIGACEWQSIYKSQAGIDKNVVVIDCLIVPLIIAE